ncbi:putative allantoinase [Helianthus anomalus]
MENHKNSPFDRPSQVFNGIRFVLLGYDPLKNSQVSLKFVNGGAVNVGKYGPNCTHVIVDKLVYQTRSRMAILVLSVRHPFAKQQTDKLWEALMDGDIDILSFAHSPSDLEHKLFAEGDFLGHGLVYLHFKFVTFLKKIGIKF